MHITIQLICRPALSPSLSLSLVPLIGREQRRLRFVSLAWNDISCVPDLAALESLHFLDLSNNRIDVFEPELLPFELQALAMQHNPCSSHPAYQHHLLAALPYLTVSALHLRALAAVVSGRRLMGVCCAVLCCVAVCVRVLVGCVSCWMARRFRTSCGCRTACQWATRRRRSRTEMRARQRRRRCSAGQQKATGGNQHWQWRTWTWRSRQVYHCNLHHRKTTTPIQLTPLCQSTST